MAKLTLADVSNILGSPTSAQNTINNNSRLIEDALENTLSRDGTTPNQMNSDIDMNNNDLLNVESLEVNSLVLNGIPVGTEDTPLLILTEVIEARDQAQAWAEGTLPGGPGTKSAKEWAEFASTVTAGSVTTAASLAALKAINTTNYKAVLLTDPSRKGLFVWTLGNFNTVSTVDVNSGIYVVSDSVPAITGAWVRVVLTDWDIKWFGAVGDGVADDTVAIQSALNLISRVGGGHIKFQKGFYKISSPLEYSPQVAEGDSTTGSDLLFASLPVLRLEGFGNAEIVASVAMTHMLRITFGAGDPGPNQCSIYNVAFNGAGLASIGVFSEWPMGTNVSHCRIFDVDIGVRVYGRGGALINDNFIRARIGVSLTRGGDTIVKKNHIFLKGAAGSNRAAAYFGAWSGNSKFLNNTIQAEPTDNVDHINTRGLWMDGTVSDTIGSDVAKGVRDILCDGNEFHGIQICVLAVSDTLTLTTGVCNIHVTNNHAMQGWWSSTELIYAQKVVNLNVEGNFHNIVGTNSVNLAAAQFDGCVDVLFKHNQVSNVSGTNAILVTTSSDDVRIEDNIFINAVLTASTGVVFVQNSNNIKVKKNTFKQYSAYTTICVTEDGTTAVGNDFSENDFSSSFTVPYSTSNPNTVARRVEQTTWYPTDASRGAWRQGDKVYILTPTAGGSVGYVCTAAGSPGTWKAFGTIAA